MSDSKGDQISTTANAIGPIKLNPFQQVMALWEEAEPYNAGAVFQLRGRANFEALQGAIQESCQEAGLGKLLLDRKRRSYEYKPIETIRLEAIQSGDRVLDTLGAFLTEQVKLPFPLSPHHPVKWFVIDDLRSESHFLVLVWRHFIADGVSIRLLLRRVFARYFGTASAPPRTSLRMHPPDYGEVMKSHYRRLGYIRTLARACRLYGRLRYVYRLPESIDRGAGSRVLLFDTPQHFLLRLTAACRRRRVSVNDAFLTTLGAAMARITPSRKLERRRRGLALAAAVDPRQVAPKQLSDCFGLFVGHWVTLLNDPDSGDFDAMLDEVVRQTRVEKGEKRFGGPEWDFLTVLLLRRWLGAKEDRSWYRKVYPFSAGLSYIKMRSSEFPGGRGKVLACFPIPPTGPALPLVVSPATVDDQLKLTAVYREAALSDSQVRTLMDLFLTRLEHFSKGDD